MSNPIPIELKSITPFVTRANELTKADPVISYWCTFYAVQHAMTLGSKAPESNVYLFSLMDKLELMKQELDGNENVMNDIDAGSYIESFAGKIFDQADDEDRTGAGTRMTAKKFLAAGNFLELLTIFGEISTENREKIKYSKWKASDIAKAFREGRTPIPGPAGGLPPNDDPALSSNQITSEEAKELAKEFAELDVGSGVGQEEEEEGGKSETSRREFMEPTAPQAEEVEEVEASYPFPQQPTTLPSFPDSPPPLPSASFPDEPQTPFGEEHPTTPTFPSFLNTPTSAPSYPTSEISTPPTPQPPVILQPPPTTHQTAFLPPPNPSPHATKPVFPSAVFPTIPTIPQAQTLTNWTSVPSPSSTAVSVPVSVSPVVVTEEDRIGAGGLPQSLDPSVVARIQKHLKWSGSALNYDDYVTARKELKAALVLLGE